MAARVSTEALMAIKGPIDRKSTYAAFKGLTKVKSDMMCAPWYFGPGDRHQANHAGRMSVINGNGFKTLTDCFQSKDSDLADIIAIEAKGGLVN